MKETETIVGREKKLGYQLGKVKVCERERLAMET